MSTIYLFMGKLYDYNPQFGVREDVNPKTWTNVTDIDDPDLLNSSEQYGAVGPIGVIGQLVLLVLLTEDFLKHMGITSMNAIM